MDLKLNKPKEKQEEITRIASNIYLFHMNVPRDIRYSVLKHDCFPKFQTNLKLKIKPLIEDMSLLTMYKQDA